MEKNFRTVCFGELMLRLQPNLYTRFLQADTFEATFGGGEANVSVSLANFGLDSAYVSKFPKHEIGQMAENSLRYFGVYTSCVTRGGDRMGIYYIEKGASVRPSKVIYDRAYSAIALAERSDFDWEKILDGADWFHITGITPALGDNVAEIVLDALKVCKAKGIKVSCDLNYRKKLWTREKAGKVMAELMPYVNVCIANEEDAGDVFGIKAENTDVEKGISANDNRWAAMLYDGENYCFSKKYDLHIVDRVGGGDSFGAGLIYSLLTGKDTQSAIEFAVAASALKHTIEGDYNMVTVAEVENLLKSGGSGRVQR